MPIAARWGLKENEEFEITALTSTFDAANSRLANIRQSDVVLIYLDYSKGAEDKLEIKMEYSLCGDAPPNEEFFEECVVSNASGEVTPFRHFFLTTGKYRIALPMALGEDRIRVSVRGVGAAVDGTAKLYFSTNNPRFQYAKDFRTG